MWDENTLHSKILIDFEDRIHERMQGLNIQAEQGRYPHTKTTLLTHSRFNVILLLLKAS